MTTKDSRDHCFDIAEKRIESLGDGREVRPLDITYEVKPQGQITEIRLTTTAGGPNVEIELMDQIIYVSWGGESISRRIFDEEAQDRLSELYEKYMGMANF